MPTSSPLTRRERLRAQTLSEIREHGYAQIARGGPAALSLNGIAKAMGMSGAAMYRYFASRDALLTTLVSESYEDLAAALADAYAGAGRSTPQDRMRTTCRASRAWALAQPHRYRLVFESTFGSGAGDPERIIPAAQRGMNVLLDALAGLLPAPAAVTPPSLARDLARWGQTTSHPDADPGLYLLAQRTWTRLHGIVSLEIEGVYTQMGIDPELMYEDEIEQIIADAQPTSGD